MTLDPGPWRLPPDGAAARHDDHAHYFGPHGELITSVATPTGVTRMLLTWRWRGDALVIDQPSAPREETVPVLVASERTLCLGTTWYVRDDAAPLDPEAPWWALVAGGAWHGVASAGPEPFVPFLLVERGRDRSLLRVVAGSSDEAELAADRIAAEQPPFDRAVWVRDGRLRGPDGDAIDAVVVTRIEPGGARAASHALPYRLVDGAARIAGALHTPA